MGTGRLVEEGTGGSWYDPVTTAAPGREKGNRNTQISAT